MPAQRFRPRVSGLELTLAGAAWRRQLEVLSDGLKPCTAAAWHSKCKQATITDQLPVMDPMEK
jgi:hypothetical protein